MSNVNRRNVRNVRRNVLTLAIAGALATGAFFTNTRKAGNDLSVAVSKTVATLLGLKADPKFKTKFLVNSAELDTVKRKLHDAYLSTDNDKLASVYNTGLRTLEAL